MRAGETTGDDGADGRFGQARRIVEALLFASARPLPSKTLARAIPDGVGVEAVLASLAAEYEGRGVNLRAVAGGYAFRTAPDRAWLLAGRRSRRAGSLARPSRCSPSSPTTSR